MKTQQPKQISLWNALTALGDLSGRSMSGANACFGVPDLVAGSVLGGRGHEFYGRSVLVATSEQLTAIATLIELDGLASRIVLYPPDLPLEHLSFVAKIAAADAIVSDRLETESDLAFIRSLRRARSLPARSKCAAANGVGSAHFRYNGKSQAGGPHSRQPDWRHRAR